MYCIHYYYIEKKINLQRSKNNFTKNNVILNKNIFKFIKY